MSKPFKDPDWGTDRPATVEVITTDLGPKDILFILILTAILIIIALILC